MLVICTTMLYNVLNTFGYRCIPHIGKVGEGVHIPCCIRMAEA